MRKHTYLACGGDIGFLAEINRRQSGQIERLCWGHPVQEDDAQERQKSGQQDHLEFAANERQRL